MIQKGKLLIKDSHANLQHCRPVRFHSAGESRKIECFLHPGDKGAGTDQGKPSMLMPLLLLITLHKVISKVSKS